MKRFDILDPQTPILGKRFLEASAGTGKTFAIEHLVARLIQEEGLQLDEIVVVTFTRAAARELKARIRKRLAEKGASLHLFDRAQVFTIHAFCQKILTEFAFEAKTPFSVEYWTAAEEREALLHFLRTADFLSASQAAALLKKARGRSSLLPAALLRGRKEAGKSFAEVHACFTEKIAAFRGAPISAEFERIRPHYKKMTSAQFPLQAAFLERGAVDRDEFDMFLAADSFFLEQIFEENRKKKSPPQTHPTLDRLREELLPLLTEAADADLLMRRVAYAWEEKRTALSAELNRTTHDELLRSVEKCVEEESFVKKIRKRVKAAIIDEFQDTDPVQWKIFKTLFFTEEIQAFYLVGDPKQSIYGFRGADVYTYMAARECFGEDNCAVLDTNYRTQHGLGEALSRLFCPKPWLDLPKLKTNLPVLPLQYDKKGDGLLHFMVCEEEPDVFRFLASTIDENVKTAVLVKDKYQAHRVRLALQAYGIPCSVQRGACLADSLALEAMQELAAAVLHGKEIGNFLAGPLCRWTEDDFTPEKIAEARAILSELKATLVDRGFAAFYAAFLRSKLFIAPDFYPEVEAIAELAMAETDPERLEHLFKEIEQESLEEKILGEQKGVAILTIHMSKGLEFDTVFALGLAEKAEADDEEAEAEMMRQLYVACTRAKTRLYIPLRGEGIIDRFWQKVQPDLSQFSYTNLNSQTFIPIERHREEPPAPLPPIERVWPERRVVSFSSLAQPVEHHTPFPEGILPVGAETGVIVHRILDRFFTEDAPLEKLVAQETVLEEWKEPLCLLLEKSIDLLSLREIPRRQRVSELEFLYSREGEIVKGFIDLCFEREGRYYLVDWKTNYLPDYTPESLERAMREGDYFLQAELYAEALRRYVCTDLSFGGAYYVFVRGPAAYHFQPRQI